MPILVNIGDTYSSTSIGRESTLHASIHHSTARSTPFDRLVNNYMVGNLQLGTHRLRFETTSQSMSISFRWMYSMIRMESSPKTASFPQSMASFSQSAQILTQQQPVLLSFILWREVARNISSTCCASSSPQQSSYISYWCQQILHQSIRTKHVKCSAFIVQFFTAQTCLIAISPILAECFRMLSRKSFRSDIDASLILSRILGIVWHIACENRYLLTRGRYVCSSCSSVFSAG
jgi:hypothetical protein